jgi:ferric-dicitrate binding protein FerR (iron transport regulator)
MVRAYTTDRTTRVGVAEGRVAVGVASRTTILSPGDIGDVVSNGAASVTHNATIADVFGWTRGQFTLKDVALGDVAHEFERQYDLTLKIDDSALAGRTVTVAFTGQSATDMLTAIALIGDASYTRRGNVVVLSPKPHRGL